MIRMASASLELPPGWSQARLGSLLRRQPSYGVNAAATPYQPGSAAYIRITDINDESRFVPNPRVSVEHPLAASYLLEPGDLVFARTGATVGKSYLYSAADGPLVFAGFLIRITPDPAKLDPRFLSYYVQGKAYRDWVKTMSVRSGQPGINATEYAGLPMNLPPRAEQAGIADMLETVDALIESLKGLIAKKRGIKRATLHELLSGATRLPGFTDPWNELPFEALATPRMQRVDPRIGRLGERVVELEHIESGTGRLLAVGRTTESSSVKSVFMPGDVLFGRLRAYLKKYWLADREGLCSTEIWVLKPEAKRATSEYIRYVVESDRFIEASGSAYGTHMPRSDWGTVRRLGLRVPEVSEQRAIASVLAEIDAEVEAVDARLAKTRDIKQGMLQQLVTGQTRLLPAGVAA